MFIYAWKFDAVKNFQEDESLSSNIDVPKFFIHFNPEFHNPKNEDQGNRTYGANYDLNIIISYYNSYSSLNMMTKLLIGQQMDSFDENLKGTQ